MYAVIILCSYIPHILYENGAKKPKNPSYAHERSERVNQCAAVPRKGAFAAAQHCLPVGRLSIVVSSPCESVIWEIQTKKDFAHLRNANGARHIYYIHLYKFSELCEILLLIKVIDCEQYSWTQKFNIGINMFESNLLRQSRCLKTRNTDTFLVLQRI